MNQVSEKKDVWLKAAVVGGLWASLEIIIGSFLHNARLPMAGSTLAFFGSVLLIGYSQIWPEKGLIIRAGLITAIMKSVSPSAIILGPMMGIMLEAIMIEISLLIFGRNFVGYVIAGVLSVSSALFYKIISMVVFYGYDLLQVYVNIINFGLKQLQIDEAQPVEVLFVLMTLYIIMGLFAALLGVFAGRKAIKIDTTKESLELGETNNSFKNFMNFEGSQSTYLPLLFVHLVSIPIGLFLINLDVGLLKYLFIVIYLLVIGFRYRYALRKLRKPVFWMQLIIIVLLSSFFWNMDNDKLLSFDMDGFFSGLEMMIRALFVIIGFTAISIELRNSKVKTFLMNAGMGRYYKSVELAFTALPSMISMLPGSKEIIRSPVKSLLMPLVLSDRWLQHFKKREEII